MAEARVNDGQEIEEKAAVVASRPGSAVIVLPDSFDVAHREQIIAAAARHGIPAVYPYRYWAESGGLMSYGTDPADQYQRSASYVDRILRGARPSDLPVQVPTKFELVINMKTARALNLVPSRDLLYIADDVIE
jgi:putative tryptophan/tyrosine transport system substrate-binding protein